jgi:aryl-alcohol dehydrogenase-like predicted oxidoreductase
MGRPTPEDYVMTAIGEASNNAEPTPSVDPTSERATTTTLGRSDVHVSRLGAGAMTWGDPSGIARFHPAKLAYGGPAGIEEERAALEASVAAGVTLFDTAAMYSFGAAERRLGELARGREVQIATKFPPSMRSRADDMPAALEASLARLDRSSVDLYMHHFPSGRVSIPRLMDLMADAVAAGKVRAVGVSNYSAEQLRTAHAALADRGVPLASIEIGYSLLDRRVETNGVLDACHEMGVTLIAYQPLASGALTGKYADGARPAGLRRFMRAFRGSGRAAAAPVIALLREIGERHGMKPAQIALRWLIEQGDVIPIPGAKSGRQAATNAAALSFALTPTEIDALNHATLAWR